jgi:hypothetical protein
MDRRKMVQQNFTEICIETLILLLKYPPMRKLQRLRTWISLDRKEKSALIKVLMAANRLNRS